MECADSARAEAPFISLRQSLLLCISQAPAKPCVSPTAAGIATGSFFRRVSSAGRVWSDAVTEKLVWHVVKEFAAKIGVSKLAPHDLRRSCARLCRAAGGELEQIQFLLGHVSVQTTERYVGCIQRISSAVNDRIGIEPKP